MQRSEGGEEVCLWTRTPCLPGLAMIDGCTLQKNTIWWLSLRTVRVGENFDAQSQPRDVSSISLASLCEIADLVLCGLVSVVLAPFQESHWPLRCEM